MNPIPNSEQVRARLAALTHAQVQALAEKTKVPFTTLWKVRTAETKNPRLETVCAIWPDLVGLEGAHGMQPPSASAEADPTCAGEPRKAA